MRRFGIVVAAAACAMAAGTASAQASASTGHGQQEVVVNVHTANLPTGSSNSVVEMRVYGSDGEVTPWSTLETRGGLHAGNIETVTRQVSSRFGRPTRLEFSVRGHGVWAFSDANVDYRDQHTGRWDVAYSTNRGPILARTQQGGYRGGASCGQAKGGDFTVSLTGSHRQYSASC